MRIGLYKKIFFWLLLNLVLLGVMTAALLSGLLFHGSNGLLPTYIFSSKVDNTFRTISAQCQYKPVEQWAWILEQHAKGGGLFFTMYPLETGCPIAGMPLIPGEVAVKAENMPKLPFTLCPDPTIVLPSYETFTDESGSLHIQHVAPASKAHTNGITAGIQPSPPVLFMRAGEPPRYWLSRALFIPDEAQELHYVLLTASSDSVTGHGLFFDIRLILGIIGAGLVISCLWWWPFVRHISRPLLKMTAVSEELATDVSGAFLSSPPGSNICGVDPERSDEIGRLGQSINVMAQHLHGTLTRQRQFISHIAQELNLPLARIKQALVSMEELEGSEDEERLHKLIGEVEHLAVLTDDILNFLRAESGNQAPVFERVELHRFIREVIDTEAGDLPVPLQCPRNLVVSSPASYLGRAIGNVLRNSLKYAGNAEINVCKQAGNIRIDITDSGPGVPEEDLPLLANPFFRSNAGSKTSGAGLGLSIVKYCIEACNGTVSFANRKSGGFMVTILLLHDPHK